MKQQEKLVYELPNESILNKLRSQGDPLADNLVQMLFENNEAKLLNQVMRQLQTNQDLVDNSLPLHLRDFFRVEGILPTWANHDLLSQGAGFFQQYAHQLSSMLSFLSLPYTYAAAHGVKVLYFTKRIHQDTGRRLHETASFLLDVTAPDAFSPQGKGIVSSLKVRLMHAAVRYHVKNHKKWQKEWGLPINQEDMIGTNLSFSVLPVLGLKKMRYYLKQYDIKAYLHLWKVIGNFLGNNTEYLPNRYQEGVTLGDIISERHFKTSKEGRELTKALIIYLEKSIERRFPKEFVTTYMRFLLGNDTANILGIPTYNWTRLLMRPFQTNNVLKSLSPTPSRAGEKFLKQAHWLLEKDPVDFNIPLAI